MIIKHKMENKKELQWILAEYEHARGSTSYYDELGQIFCHHGVMELFEYTGVDKDKHGNPLFDVISMNSVIDSLNRTKELRAKNRRIKIIFTQQKFVDGLERYENAGK